MFCFKEYTCKMLRTEIQLTHILLSSVWYHFRGDFCNELIFIQPNKTAYDRDRGLLIMII